MPSPAETFTITFDLNGGTLNGINGKIYETHQKGEVITIPGPPTRKGYTFRYWQGSVYHPGDKYTVTGNHTLTAVWGKKIPDTGDSDNPALWIGLILLGLAGLICLPGLRQR